MQDVEHAIGKYQGPRTGAQTRRKLLRRADFLLERDPHRGYFDRTTRRL
jgi:hypothetical protein